MIKKVDVNLMGGFMLIPIFHVRFKHDEENSQQQITEFREKRITQNADSLSRIKHKVTPYKIDTGSD